MKMQHQPDLIIIVLFLVFLLSSALLAHGDDQVAVCHIAHGNLENTRTLYVDQEQFEYYLKRGDVPGACASRPGTLANQQTTTKGSKPAFLP